MAELVYNQALCEKAREIMARGKSIARLATDLGVCRETIYDWRDKHPEFAKALKAGRDAAQAHWEDIGEEGVLGEIKNFSATTWIFTMKNRFRDDYKEDKKDNPVAEVLMDKLIDRLVD